MSKLADLLNPAPSSATPHSAQQAPSPASAPSRPHRRNDSIASPLEALALASTSAPLTASATIAAPSFTNIPPNPYAIKPHQSYSPPAGTAHMRPASSSTQPVVALSATSQASMPTKPAATTTPSLSFQPAQAESTQPVVKSELTDDAEVSATLARTTTAVKPEPPKPELLMPVPPQSQPDIEMKDGIPDSPSITLEPKQEDKKPVIKKGTAKKAGHNVHSITAPKKPSSKKRKFEPESKDGTPFSQRSETPSSSRTSKTPARKNTPQHASSPSPYPPAPTTTITTASTSTNGTTAQSTAAVDGEDDDDEDEDEDSDDNDVFCICRKPDDHTWMIACDAGCDDWFHGRCVGMSERDGNLIDKYVCPNCEARGEAGTTMWKPMCRLPGCREPARVQGKKPSKYCSDEHGRAFMRQKATMGVGKAKKESGNKRRKQSRTDNMGNEGDERDENEDSDDAHQAHLRGGLLKLGELKALAMGVKSIGEFKKLGERIATPESTPPDTNVHMKMEDGDTAPTEEAPPAPKLQLTEQEHAALEAVAKRKADLQAQLEMLADKDKLLAMVKARHKSVLEELKRKEGIKDICGYDARLTWSDEEFGDWRASDEGKQALTSGVLLAPHKKAEQDGASTEEEDSGRGVCKKKRCERHKTWAKLEQNEVNLARSNCWHQMRKLESDEQGIRERAMLRQLEAKK